MNVFLKILKKLSFNKSILSLFFFIISLTQFAYITTNYKGDDITNSIIFLVSSITLSGRVFKWIIWLANPLYFIFLNLITNGETQTSISFNIICK